MEKSLKANVKQSDRVRYEEDDGKREEGDGEGKASWQSKIKSAFNNRVQL